MTALESCKQRHLEGNRIVSKALDLDEALNHTPSQIPKEMQLDKAALAVRLYLEGGERLKSILIQSTIGFNRKEVEELKDLQITVKKTLEMVHLRSERLLTIINDPKHRRISTPKRTFGQSTNNQQKNSKFTTSSSFDSSKPPVIKGVDPSLVTRIMEEIVDKSNSVEWDDISGLEGPKSLLKEAILLPFQRPDIFIGVRAPPRGILMFGPPGTGKTLLAKAVASTANCTFFALSASSITSKWLGESEKLIRALFACARHFQPSIIFIDEIDSLLQTRSDSENESMRRVKTEFLLQFDGMNSVTGEKIVIIGATNRPGDLDEAARRRFTKRILIPLPDKVARKSILQKLLTSVSCALTPKDFDKLVQRTESFSAADITALASDIALNPVRELDIATLLSKPSDTIRPINWTDVEKSLKTSRSSVDPLSIATCEQWNQQYGSS